MWGITIAGGTRPRQHGLEVRIEEFRDGKHGTVWLSWIKARAGADSLANRGAAKHAQPSRKGNQCPRPAAWRRRKYTQLRSSRGRFQSWAYKTHLASSDTCSPEAGWHIAFECPRNCHIRERFAIGGWEGIHGNGKGNQRPNTTGW